MDSDTCTLSATSHDRWQPFWDNVCRTEMAFRVTQYCLESINLVSHLPHPSLLRGISLCSNIRNLVATTYFIKYLAEFHQGDMLQRNHWLDHTSDILTVVGSFLMPIILVDDWGLLRLGRFALATGYVIGAFDILSYACEALSGGVEALNERAKGNQVSIEINYRIIDNSLELSFLIIETYLLPKTPKAIFITAGIISGGWGLFRVSPFSGSVYHPIRKKRRTEQRQ